MERSRHRSAEHDAMDEVDGDRDVWSRPQPATLTLTSCEGKPMGNIHLPDARMVTWEGADVDRPMGGFGLIHQVRTWNGTPPPQPWVVKEFILAKAKQEVVEREVASATLLSAAQGRGELTTGIVQIVGLAKGTVVDREEHNQRSFYGIVMRRVAGANLSEWSDTRDVSLRMGREQPTMGALLRALVRASRTIAELHQRNLAHGDLKPHNIMVEPFTTSDPRVTIVDVGSMIETDKRVDPQALYGRTPGFTQRGQQYPTKTGDVYGLGASAFNLITDHVFGGDKATDRTLIAEKVAHPALREAILSTCQPQHNSISAGQFADLLERAIKDMP
jgi:serine/threonine protein kinase